MAKGKYRSGRYGCILRSVASNGRFSWLRNPFLLQVDEFGPKHQFSVFSMSLVCVVGTFVACFNAISLRTIQDFELAAFKPLSIKMFKIFFEMPIFIVF